jgi:hypothetical protein
MNKERLEQIRIVYLDKYRQKMANSGKVAKTIAIQKAAQANPPKKGCGSCGRRGG